MDGTAVNVGEGELEANIRRIGGAFVTQSTGHVPTVFNAKWWASTLLDWSMKDEEFKVQLFRFIDVLPSLKHDTLVAKVVEEYFGGEDAAKSPLHWGLRAISGTRLGAFLSAKSLRHQIHQMAYTFIAGASVEEAAPALEKMWKTGRGFSVDLLGEATVSEPEADHYQTRCLEALRVLGAAVPAWPSQPSLERDHLGPLPRVQLSVKLSALYSQMDPIDPEGTYEAISARLRPILDEAVRLPAAITFDMEQAETKSLTIAIFKRLLAEREYAAYPYAGIALQAYLKETEQDLTDLIAWARRRGAPVGVRLVKGAYWDADTIRYEERGWPVPVFEDKVDTDASYEALTRKLVEHAEIIRPAFGTHNLRSLAHAQAYAEAAGLTPEATEFQMIFGMAEPLQATVAESGRRVRIYTPVGEILPGMAYLVRRLLENTSNESFLRQEYHESTPIEVLLAAPVKGTLPSSETTTQSGRPAGGMSDEASETGAFCNEPHTDFSRAEARGQMQHAVERVRKELGKTCEVAAPSRVTPSGLLESRNPSAPEQVVGRVAAFSPDEADRIARATLTHYPAWSRTPADARADILTKAAGIMRRERFDLAAWEVFETGKPWREADADIAEAIDFLEFYACQMRRLGRPRRLGRIPGELNHLVYEPRGLAVVISPWNFPLAIPTGVVSAAAVTGNVVLFKPSERSPIMGAHLVRILREAGMPEGVVQFVPGEPDLGRRLVGHPDVQVVAFTGSRAVGLEILQRAAKVEPGRRFVTRVIAEMGGKNAIIVDATADLDEAVLGVVSSFTGYQGQKCSACSRAIVLDTVHETFVRRLKDAVMSLRIGPPDDPRTKMGPMIDARARDKVREYIAIGKKEGRLLVERPVAGAGYFIGPAIFTDIRPEHRLAQEEIFGPVLGVMRAKDFEEALRLANDCDYALTGGIYSRSPGNIETARRAFDVGNLYINRPITGSLVGRQPFGGHRLSGVGAKAGSEDYLPQFMTAKAISENTTRRGFAPPA